MTAMLTTRKLASAVIAVAVTVALHGGWLANVNGNALTPPATIIV